jgi:hypothetical protein
MPYSTRSSNSSRGDDRRCGRDHCRRGNDCYRYEYEYEYGPNPLALYYLTRPIYGGYGRLGYGVPLYGASLYGGFGGYGGYGGIPYL